MFSSKYYLKKDKHWTFFHLNIFFLPFPERKLRFGFIGITESCLKLSKNPNINSIQLPGYNTEFKLTESSNGWKLLYIKKGINYKLRKGLQNYKSKQLESTFIEIFQNKEKIVIGSLYRILWI